MDKSINDHSAHQFSEYLHQFLEQYKDNTCICSYSKSDPASYLLPRFFKHINWEKILLTVQKQPFYKKKMKFINESLTKEVNSDIKPLNLQITDSADWK